jgi:hypothetical protein
MGFRDRDALRKNHDACLLVSRDNVHPLLLDIAFPEDPFATAPGATPPHQMSCRRGGSRRVAS